MAPCISCLSRASTPRWMPAKLRMDHSIYGGGYCFFCHIDVEERAYVRMATVQEGSAYAIRNYCAKIFYFSNIYALLSFDNSTLYSFLGCYPKPQ